MPTSGPVTRLFERVAWLLMLVFLVWLPLPLGSNRPVFWVVNGIAAAIIVCFFLLSQTRGTFPWRSAALPLVASVLLVGWLLVQALIAFPVPVGNPLAGDFGMVAVDEPRPISISPAATLTALEVLLPTLLLGFVAAALTAGPKRVGVLLWTVVGTASVIAVGGLIARVLGVEAFFSLGQVRQGTAFFSGTFVNPNNAATYFALALACAASLFFWVLAGDAKDRESGSVLGRLLLRGGLPLVCMVVLAIALLNTGSRAGIASAALGLLVVAAMATRHFRGGFFAFVPLIVGAAVLAAAIAGDQLSSRLEEGISDTTRWSLYRDALEMIAVRPLLGYGAGTFAMVYPLFHGAGVPTDEIWLRAHDTYLQAMVEIGVPATIMMLVALVYVFGRAARGALRRDRLRPASLAAVGGSVIVAIHAVFDFSIEIQAISILFAVLLGTGFQDAAPDEEAPKRRRTSARKPAVKAADLPPPKVRHVDIPASR